jgi:hypothetical protein
MLTQWFEQDSNAFVKGISYQRQAGRAACDGIHYRLFYGVAVIRQVARSLRTQMAHRRRHFCGKPLHHSRQGKKQT